MLNQTLKTFMLVSIVTAGIVILFSFQHQKEEYYQKSDFILTQADELKLEIEELQKLAKGFQLGKVEVDSLRNAVLNSRLAYKEIEFYLDYEFHEYVNSHINGAPLLHIERTGTSPDIIPPEGLQVLDELVFAEHPEEDKTKIASIATKLRNSYVLLAESLPQKEIKPKQLIAALRLQLIRIFSLGVSGFDTPGSLNALPEAEVSLKSMLQFIHEHERLFNRKEAAFLQQKLAAAAQYVNSNNDFNTFDRLKFFRNYIDPLYKKLGGVKSEIPEFLAYNSSWDPASESMFSEDFLNPYFFTELSQKEDSESLKALGESLFYDPVLSNNEKLSCASCHQPELAFTDGKAKSMSNVQGKTVLRNSPTLLNAVYADRYFYDLRAYTLEQQAEHVIFNQEEFNTAYSSILAKLNANKEYKNRFRKVFGKSGITRENFTKALAAYVLSLTSFNSEFDQYIRNESNTLSDEAKQGFNLFMGKAACATCHFAPTFSGLVPPYFSDSESEILGVLAQPNQLTLDQDLGRLDNHIENEAAWIYEKSFKTTTVRNVALTAPYFHNGAYQTLEEVLEFYNEGGGAGKGLEVTNQTLGEDPLELTNAEMKAIITFLKTLNDAEVE